MFLFEIALIVVDVTQLKSPAVPGDPDVSRGSNRQNSKTNVNNFLLFFFKRKKKKSSTSETLSLVMDRKDKDKEVLNFLTRLRRENRSELVERVVWFCFCLKRLVGWFWWIKTRSVSPQNHFFFSPWWFCAVAARHFLQRRASWTCCRVASSNRTPLCCFLS